MKESDGMIEIRNARCNFQHGVGHEVAALNNVSLSIREGEFVCLLGRSGHGKSTLLRAIAGLTSLSGGTIEVGGRTVTGPGAERGLVFQEDTVFPWMSVRQNVEFGLRVQNKPKPLAKQEAERWIEAVGLSDVCESWPRQLSGGMRKRVAISAVFAGGAPIILMDEPFGPLDYVTRRDLQNLLLDLWQRTGRTIIFVTHDIEEALVLAQRVLVLRRGSIVDDIAVDLPRPRNEEERASQSGIRISKTILEHLEVETSPTNSQYKQR